MPHTDDLSRSFFDLWHHLDPVEASRFDPAAPPLRLAGFDAETVEQHGAALRSLAGAVEALEPESLDDDIDQTMLLDAIRGVERTFLPDAPRLGDPAFWLARLCESVAARPGDDALLAAVPAWAADAAGAWQDLSRPSAVTAAALLEWVLAELATEPWARVPPEVMTAAHGDLRSLADALAAGAGPDTEPVVAGEEEVSWRLHYEYTVQAGAAEALRATAALADDVLDWLAKAEARAGAEWKDIARRPMASPHEPVTMEPWPAFRSLIDADVAIRVGSGGVLGVGDARVSARHPERAGVVADVRYGAAGGAGVLAARSRARSEIRRRYALPGLIDAWGLFVQASVARRTDDPALAVHLLADLYRRVLVGAADLAIHQGKLDPADALAGLADRLPVARPELEAEIRRIALRPVESAGAVLVYREWERLAAAWPGGEGPLAVAVLAEGLTNPALLRWRHGVDV